MSNSDSQDPGSGQHLRGVARGGALNLIGAVIWGASNFLLLAILTRSVGAASAGVVIVGIAVFNILATIVGLGCSSGLVRHISHYRALKQTDRIRPTLVVALVPVAVMGAVIAALLWMQAPWVAELFGADPDEVDMVSATLRTMAPFLPIGAVYTVLIQGTRGFDTMRPAVLVDKIGRGLLLPTVVVTAVALDASPAAIGGLWAATFVVALIPATRLMMTLVRDAEHNTAADEQTPPLRSLVGPFWRFTGPRAVGQISEVTVNWLDTLVVGAMLGAAAAGIYGAGTRYLLPGLFVADAIMQVVGPRVSGMLSSGENRDAGHMLTVATGWQSLVLWPVYAVVLVFAPVLLKLFGPEVVEATGALRWLAAAVLLSALAGPAASVILMSGRSLLAMFNSLVLVLINIFGNLWLVPDYGLSGAGFVWAVTLVTASVLPAIQARVTMGVSTFGTPGVLAGVVGAVSFLPVSILAAYAIGQTWLAVAAAMLGGFVIYAFGVKKFAPQLELASLRSSLRPRSGA